MTDGQSSPRGLVRRLLREPLVHFLLIGAALFGLYSLTPAGRLALDDSREIRLTLDDLAQLVQVYQSQWRRPPTPAELERLVEERVQQEILYREALGMGLDQDDEIVKRRMAQKMQFLAEDVAAAREPDTAELRDWFVRNASRFARPARVGFRHLYFSPDQRGVRARQDAERALVTLAGQPQDAPVAATLGDPFMFQDYYRDRAPDFLGKEFGPPFAVALARVKPGSWQGPIQSGFGWHLVFVDTLIPGRVPEFEEIEPEVKAAWLAEQKAEAWSGAYKEMRARYTVLLPGPPEAGGAGPAASPVPARPGAPVE